ncbi:MAG: hypothetical protein HYX61_01675 [Gammaproteobacteria bacterium]|jgi:hypothetical protein|nr:hypothetical protein [Gammaproteobacteria bacterium]
MLAQQNLMIILMITSIAASGTLIGALISYMMIHRHYKPSKNKLMVEYWDFCF